MARTFFCRQWLRTGTVKVFTGVSRIGSSQTPPSSFDQQTPIDKAHLGGNNNIDNAIAIVVIAIAVTALLCLCVFLWLFRCNRLSNHHRAGAGAAATASTSSSSSSSSSTAAVVPVTTTTMVVGQQEESSKKGLGDEGSNGGGKWSAKRVELVVMAGEDRPTFVAHPVPAAAEYEKAVVHGMSSDPSQITILGGSS